MYAVHYFDNHYSFERIVVYEDISDIQGDFNLTDEQIYNLLTEGYIEEWGTDGETLYLARNAEYVKHGKKKPCYTEEEYLEIVAKRAGIELVSFGEFENQ